jgi:hypothetical protein
MLKKYKAKSCISISVVLATGGNTHISFNPVTGGGSVYYTENEKIQAGLEAHPKYGRLFVEDKTLAAQQAGAAKQAAAKQAAAKAQATAGADNEAAAEPQPTGKEGKEAVEVKMSCNDDAKDYLADKFGVSRSKMRSRADIEKVAADNGVNIVWE